LEDKKRRRPGEPLLSHPGGVFFMIDKGMRPRESESSGGNGDLGRKRKKLMKIRMSPHTISCTEFQEER
jgi:hypothetical protein